MFIRNWSVLTASAVFLLLERVSGNAAGLAMAENTLFSRETSPTGALLCSDGAPCADGSCCSTGGICGYGPAFCGSGNCTSNCDATAMCGIYSEGGKVSCGMNLCCSATGWCGTTENYCVGPDQWSTCQEGYGGCTIIQPKTCGENSGTSAGRTIGYYQGSNTYNRACNLIYPSDIKLDGYTHLYYAFASISPVGYIVYPPTNEDSVLMQEFTALKSQGVETWIAIGGFGFSDPTADTFHTWSNLTSTAENRASFITNLMDFMDGYGFQGVDLDWEYPGDATRGGSPADTENYVALVKEMRAAFGTKYGISLTLAPDYWYLRWFDAIAMEPYVDWFGFMAYDLHGYWDSDVATLGSLVRGQSDIREIYNDTLPLWFDGLDGSKINFGLALYGRGYTLTDVSCTTLGCSFSGPSKPGVCTQTAGVLSLVEIEQIIQENGLTPTLLTDSMMKQITWDGQWMGYDDADTIAMKKKFANNYCFGGTMAWSVDFNSGTGSGLTPNVTTDGKCGPSNGGTICGNEFGDCCSASGWCGSTLDYCGSGCISGSCVVGGLTTDGTCGVLYRNFTCGLWSAGSCCSASGFCGSGDAYCGTGCQSDCGPIPQYENCAPGFACADTTGGTDDYTKVDCTNSVITNAATNPAVRWTQTYAEQAWAAAVDSWTASPSPGGLTFPEQISNFFHGPEGMACGTTSDHNGCGTYSECSDTDYPAGYLILNSLVALDSIVLNWYDGISRVEANILTQVASIGDVFAPIPKEPDAIKFLLDILQIGYGLGAASMWNSVLKGLQYFKSNSNTLGVLKDSVNSMVSSGLGIVKDLQPSTSAELSEQNTIQANIGAIIDAWYSSIDTLNSNLWNGSDNNIATIHNLIEGGQLLENAFTPISDSEIQNMLGTSIFASLIPATWQLNGWPVVLDVSTACGNAVDFQKLINNNYIDDSAINDWTCINGQIYYLVTPQVDSETCGGGDGTAVTCYPNNFVPLPGLDKLDGTVYGGITKDDIITGAVNTYVNSGNSNLGPDNILVLDTNSVTQLLEYNVTAPGVVTIPVCNTKVAWHNWGALGLNTPSSSIYPCN